MRQLVTIHEIPSDPLEGTISLDEAAALCHMNREEARHALGWGGAGILAQIQGKVRIRIDDLIAWRKSTR